MKTTPVCKHKDASLILVIASIPIRQPSPHVHPCPRNYGRDRNALTSTYSPRIVERVQLMDATPVKKRDPVHPSPPL